MTKSFLRNDRNPANTEFTLPDLEEAYNLMKQVCEFVVLFFLGKSCLIDRVVGEISSMWNVVWKKFRSLWKCDGTFTSCSSYDQKTIERVLKFLPLVSQFNNSNNSLLCVFWNRVYTQLKRTTKLQKILEQLYRSQQDNYEYNILNLSQMIY